MQKDVTGIILAGGKSSRMGVDKGLLEVNGQPMIQSIIDTLKSITKTILIISNNSEYKKFGIPVYEDLIKEQGPVGGIYTALEKTDTETNIIISCDTPFITTEVLYKLLQNSETEKVVIAKHNGREHPLLGIYKKESSKVFKSNLDQNQLKLRLVNTQLDYKVVVLPNEEFTNRTFANINTKEDLKQISNGN